MVDEIILLVDGAISMQGEKDNIWNQIRDSAKCDCRKDCLKEGEIYADCPR